MLDDADEDAPAFDPPEPDRVYRYYLETCRRAGVEPVPRDRAQDLIAEWTALAYLSPVLEIGSRVRENQSSQSLSYCI